MYLHGIGALFAVIGGVLFVATVTWALMRPQPVCCAATGVKAAVRAIDLDQRSPSQAPSD
jgi:hypothetical protein